MGNRKKVPDDMDLFRETLGDVRPISRKKRVQHHHRVTRQETSSPVTDTGNSPPADRCSASPQKKAFESMREATAAAQQVRREWENPVRPYLCHACDKFHLTSDRER